MSARHRVKRRSRAAKVVAVPAIAALLTSGVVDQPVRNQEMIHQSLAEEVRQPNRVVAAEQVALAALALFAVPGAGVQFPPGALDTQDGGIWRRIQDITVLNDPTRYPGTVTRASVDAGATWLTELILARDPSTTVSGINTGSFGGRVAAEALTRVAATGYDMSSVFAVFYGDSNTPGTGIFARYGPDEPTFGSDVPGGAIQLPDGTYLRVNREYDPIAYFPKYLFNPMSWIQLAAGFIFEHSRLDHFDFEDPENVVTVDGNVVTVRVNSPVMPLLLPLQTLGVPKQTIDAFQAILQPMVESTGMYETGRMQFLPSPQEFFRHLQAVAEGFQKAGQILAGNYPEPEEPGEPPVVTAPDSTTEIIDAMEDRDEELDGPELTTARPERSITAVKVQGLVAEVVDEQDDDQDEEPSPGLDNDLSESEPEDEPTTEPDDEGAPAKDNELDKDEPKAPEPKDDEKPKEQTDSAPAKPSGADPE